MTAKQQIDLEQLKMLLDYTKFHLGVYLTLLGAIIAFISSDWGPTLRSLPSRLLYVSVVLLALSGACGGVVGASALQESGYTLFKDKPIGPGRSHWMRGEDWASAEHWIFWIAVTVMVVALGIFVSQGRSVDGERTSPAPTPSDDEASRSTAAAPAD